MQQYEHKLTAAIPKNEIKKLEKEGWEAVSTILDEDETVGGIYWKRQK